MKAKKVLTRYKHFKKIKISNCHFADEVVIFAPTEKDLQNYRYIWKETLEQQEAKCTQNHKITVVSNKILKKKL